MLHQPPASPRPTRLRLPGSTWRRLLALSCLSVLVLDAPVFLLTQGRPPDSELRAQENRQVALAELDQILEATGAKLVAAATELREELEALKQEKEGLAAELQEAETRRTELESSKKAAQARIAELSEALDVASRKTARVETEAKKTRSEMEAKLDAATDELEQSRAELAELREELGVTRQQLASAKSAREQSVARVSEMEGAIERSGAEAERVKMELTTAREQLSQAAGAAREAERAREEYAAARTEIERLRTANTALEHQIASWDRDSKSAIEAARDNQILMEVTIEELKAALGVSRPEKAAPVFMPQPKPQPTKDERSAEIHAPAAEAQAPEPTRTIGADHPSDGARELSRTELSKFGVKAIRR
jgi:chromosome segregation ATPase